MTTPHKDADKLIAIAHGKQMQVRENGGTPWVNTNPDRALVAICAGEPCRIKPETVTINGVECPKPSKVIDNSNNWILEIFIRQAFMGTPEKVSMIPFDSKHDVRLAIDALIKPFKECQE